MPIHKPVTNPKGGRPEVALTSQELTQLETMAGFLSQREAAAIIGISENTMTKLIRENESVNTAWKKGRANANLAVSQSLFKNATQKMNPLAQLFWLKCMAGWTEATPEQEKPTINITYTQAPDRIERDVTPRPDHLELDADG
jgi:predicted DNA-binding protein (UPF0251 family)